MLYPILLALALLIIVSFLCILLYDVISEATRQGRYERARKREE